MLWHKQLFERATCIFKEHAYFIHTPAPLSSVLIALPHKAPILAPFMNQLKRKANFSLTQELQKHKILQKEKEILSIQSDVLISNSIYGIKFDEATEFLVCDPSSG
jgi:hypothetical protein